MDPNDPFNHHDHLNPPPVFGFPDLPPDGGLPPCSSLNQHNPFNTPPVFNFPGDGAGLHPGGGLPPGDQLNPHDPFNPPPVFGFPELPPSGGLPSGNPLNQHDHFNPPPVLNFPGAGSGLHPGGGLAPGHALNPHKPFNPPPVFSFPGAGAGIPTDGLPFPNQPYPNYPQELYHQHQPQPEPQIAVQPHHPQPFWADQYREIERFINFRYHNLPLARIKRIMKADDDVNMISVETPVVFSRACEMFILQLTYNAWLYAEADRRRTILKTDVYDAIARTDIFEFLLDLLPGWKEDPPGGGGEGEGGGGEEGGGVAPPPVGPPVDGFPYYYGQL